MSIKIGDRVRVLSNVAYYGNMEGRVHSVNSDIVMVKFVAEDEDEKFVRSAVPHPLFARELSLVRNLYKCVNCGSLTSESGIGNRRSLLCNTCFRAREELKRDLDLASTEEAKHMAQYRYAKTVGES